jgi:hypothetical protein
VTAGIQLTLIPRLFQGGLGRGDGWGDLVASGTYGLPDLSIHHHFIILILSLSPRKVFSVVHHVAQCTEHTTPAAPTMRAITLLVLFLGATQGASISETTLPQQLQVRHSRIDG